MAKKPAATRRQDAVLIRKSGDTQDERGQIENVERELKRVGVTVAKEYWFYSGKGVRRSKIAKDAEVNRLMSLVEKHQIGTIYIEKFDRFGSDEHDEFIGRIKDIRRCESKVYDVVQGRCLTDNDFVSKLLNLVQIYESRGELRKIAQRTMRTKVNNLDHRGQWPSGAAPFGFGKACYSEGKKLLWTWQPTSRTRGQHYIMKNGKLVPGQSDIQVPPRSRTAGDKPFMKLIPHTNKAYVKTIEMIFDIFTTQNISCRALAMKLNDGGRKYYDQPFNHSLVMQILRNPAYMGDTHFGKSQSGDYFTVGPDKLLIDFDEEEKRNSGVKPERRQRAVAERVIKPKTHTGLIEPKVWKLAQEKLKRIESAKRYPSRNPEYYLRPLLICGHCGKSMSGRTEIHPSTKERIVTYFCPTYLGARSKGIAPTCMSYRITHADAEALLFSYMKEMDVDFQPTASGTATQLANQQFASLGEAFMEVEDKAIDLMLEGVEAFSEYLRDNGVKKSKIDSLKEMAKAFYGEAAMTKTKKTRVSGALLKEFKAAVKDAESAAVAYATKHAKKLRADHEKYTAAWALAPDDRTRKTVDKLKAETAEQLDIWEPREQSITSRLQDLRELHRGHHEKANELEKAWPGMALAERSEAFLQMFTNVTLFWKSTFHPSPEKPTRERKTGRSGRWSHELDRDKIIWGLTPDLAGTR